MRIGVMIVAAGAALVSGCVSPIVRNGAVMPGAAAVRASSFFMADAAANDSGLVAARQAVQRELTGQGLQESKDAPYRVDVGFAVAPFPLEIAAGRDGATAPVQVGIALCRRRQYILSIAMIDRRDGQIVFRNSATAHRCAKTAAKAIPQLARAAVGH